MGVACRGLRAGGKLRPQCPHLEASWTLPCGRREGLVRSLDRNSSGRNTNGRADENCRRKTDVAVDAPLNIVDALMRRRSDYSSKIPCRLHVVYLSAPAYVTPLQTPIPTTSPKGPRLIFAYLPASASRLLIGPRHLVPALSYQGAAILERAWAYQAEERTHTVVRCRPDASTDSILSHQDG